MCTSHLGAMTGASAGFRALGGSHGRRAAEHPQWREQKREKRQQPDEVLEQHVGYLGPRRRVGKRRAFNSGYGFQHVRLRMLVAEHYP